MKIFKKKKSWTKQLAWTKENYIPKLIKFTPVDFNEVQAIASELKTGNVVLLDVSKLQKLVAIRMIDFLGGVLFVVQGTYKKAYSKTYLLAPNKDYINQFDEELGIEK